MFNQYDGEVDISRRVQIIIGRQKPLVSIVRNLLRNARERSNGEYYSRVMSENGCFLFVFRLRPVGLCFFRLRLSSGVKLPIRTKVSAQAVEY